MNYMRVKKAGGNYNVGKLERKNTAQDVCLHIVVYPYDKTALCGRNVTNEPHTEFPTVAHCRTSMNGLRRMKRMSNETICEECAKHPDYPLMVLGNIGE